MDSQRKKLLGDFPEDVMAAGCEGFQKFALLLNCVQYEFIHLTLQEELFPTCLENILARQNDAPKKRCGMGEPSLVDRIYVVMGQAVFGLWSHKSFSAKFAPFS